MTFTVSQTPDAVDVRIYPNGDDTTDFLRSEGSNNYTCVDETYSSPDDSDFVYMVDDSSEQTDEYDIANPSASGTINYVRVTARMKAVYDSTAPTVKIFNWYSSDDEGSAQSLTNTYNNYYETFTTDPASAAWNWTKINSLRAGIKGTISSQDFVHCGDSNLSVIPRFLRSDGQINGYYFVVQYSTSSDENLVAYSSALTQSNDTITFTQVDYDDLDISASGQQIFFLNNYWDGTDSHIVCGGVTSPNKADKLCYFKFTNSTETLSTVVNTTESETLELYCRGAFIDDTYVYGGFVGNSGGNCGCWLKIYSYSTSSLTELDKEYVYDNETGNMLMYTAQNQGTTPIAAYDNGSNVHHVFMGYNEDVTDDDCSIQPFTIDTTTDTITKQTVYNIGASTNEIEAIEVDSNRKYIYALVNDATNSDTEVWCFTFNGTSMS